MKIKAVMTAGFILTLVIGTVSVFAQTSTDAVKNELKTSVEQFENDYQKYLEEYAERHKGSTGNGQMTHYEYLKSHCEAASKKVEAIRGAIDGDLKNGKTITPQQELVYSNALQVFQARIRTMKQYLDTLK